MTVSRFVVSVAKVMTGVGLAVAAYVFFEYYVAKHNWRYQTFRLVGEVVQINICPLASTKEICPEEVLCTPKGISLFGVYDREFFITRTKGPDFAVESPSKLVKEYFSESFRELEAYADINVLTINAPSGQNYDIDLTHSEHSHGPAQVYRASSIVAASDQGKKISSWLSQELEEEVHLFRQTDDIMMKFNRSNMAMCSICPEESVRHIQQKFGLPSIVTASFFRPNVIITGCKALEEQWWSHVRIGDVYFQVKSQDIRVISGGSFVTYMPTLEIPAKIRHLKRLTSYGEAISVGVNALVVKAGNIRIGDPVFASKHYGYAAEDDKGVE